MDFKISSIILCAFVISTSANEQQWIEAPIPKTNFRCEDFGYDGFYADAETGCQVYHICTNGQKDSNYCPTGTLFNQKLLTCDHAGNFVCEVSPDMYPGHENGIVDLARQEALNRLRNVIGKIPDPNVPTPVPKTYTKGAYRQSRPTKPSVSRPKGDDGFRPTASSNRRNVVTYTTPAPEIITAPTYTKGRVVETRTNTPPSKGTYIRPQTIPPKFYRTTKQPVTSGTYVRPVTYPPRPETTRRTYTKGVYRPQTTPRPVTYPPRPVTYPPRPVTYPPRPVTYPPRPVTYPPRTYTKGVYIPKTTPRPVTYPPQPKTTQRTYTKGVYVPKTTYRPRPTPRPVTYRPRPVTNRPRTYTKGVYVPKTTPRPVTYPPQPKRTPRPTYIKGVYVKGTTKRPTYYQKGYYVPTTRAPKGSLTYRKDVYVPKRNYIQKKVVLPSGNYNSKGDGGYVAIDEIYIKKGGQFVRQNVNQGEYYIKREYKYFGGGKGQNCVCQPDNIVRYYQRSSSTVQGRNPWVDAPQMMMMMGNGD